MNFQVIANHYNLSILSKFIHEAMFFKYAVDVPDKMRECADIPGVLDEAAFSHFKEDTGASLIRYDKDTNQIVVLVCLSNLKTFQYLINLATLVNQCC